MSNLPTYRYRINVVRVIDGDTLVADIDLGFYTRIRTNLRLFGLNCPELNTVAGVAAREFTHAQLYAMSMDTTADIIKTDKYGNRWDAVVYLKEGTLNDLLVRLDHAKSVQYIDRGSYMERQC